MTTLKPASTIFFGALLFAATAVHGATIYDNSINDLGTRFSPGLNEIGDEIILEGPERYLTEFSFEYYAINNGAANPLTGTPEVRVRFYLNDGADFNGYATPGTSFFDSDWFTLTSPTFQPTERETLVYSLSDFPGGTPVFMPVVSNFTWSVQFRGLGAGDELGVDVYGPPDVGLSLDDYWEFSGGAWELKTNTIPMNFAARFEAVVPEPTSLALLGMGTLGLFLARRRFSGLKD